MAARQNSLWVSFDPAAPFRVVADSLVSHAANLARSARNEEELRIGFEKALDPLLRQLGVTRDPRYEKTVYCHSRGAGRADAVHGQVVIEYEAPLAFRSPAAVEHAFDQLVGYIRGAAQAAKPALSIQNPKFVGVGFDGETIFFVHYHGPTMQPKVDLDPHDFVRVGPYPFGQAPARTLLSHMRALARRLLDADELAEVFGPKGNIAPWAVKALADALHNWAASPRVRAFYDEWRRLFGIVYGEGFAAHAAEEAERLRSFYRLPATADLQELLFCVHTYFALLMKLIAAELISISETSFMSSFSHDLANSGNPELKGRLEEVESGGVFAKRGITNFLEGDFFRWYLDAFSMELADRPAGGGDGEGQVSHCRGSQAPQEHRVGNPPAMRRLCGTSTRNCWSWRSRARTASGRGSSRTPYGYKMIIPTDTTSLIATDDEGEAHYLCAVLNSQPVREFIKTYSSAGRGFGAPSVMDHVAIPRFDPRNAVHAALAELSRELHDLKAKGREAELPPREKRVDGLAEQLFGLAR